MAISRKRVIFYSLFTLILAVFSVFSLAYYQLRNLGEFKALAVENLEELTRREVKIGEAEMDIVRGLSIRLKDVSVRSRKAEEPELTARSVWVVVRLLPLLDKRVEVKKIIVQGLSLQMVRDAKGRFSVGDVKKWITRPAESNLFKILKVSLMNQVMVEDGAIHFQDYFNRSPEDPLPLNLERVSFSVRKNILDSPFQFTLKGELPNGGSPTAFQVSGAFDNLSENQGFTGISINGKVRVNELNVSSFQPYLKKVLAKTPQDSRLSLDSSFSGNLGGALKSEGTLKYSSNSNKDHATLRDARVPHRGGLEYKVSLDQDSIHIEELKSESGPFKFAVKGSLKNFLSNDPSVSFDLAADSFLVDKSIEYLPLKFFPEEYHALVQSRFKNGSIKIKSLKFEGSLDQLRELAEEKNRGLISSELEMKHVDWQSPLPPLQNVTGTFKVNKGNTTLHITKARYENQPISNVHGTINDFMTRPMLDLKVENEVEMSPFHGTLKRVFKGHPLFDSIAIYDKFEGTAKVRLNVKGPLDDFDRLAITGRIGLNNVSLNEEGFEPRLENLNGNIIYSHIPEVTKRKDAYWIPVIKYDNLSGAFSKSSFSDMNGEMGFSNGEPLEKMSATYKVASSDLIHVLSDDSEDALVGLKEGLDFISGELVLKYRSQGNPAKPETEKEWGKIELKDFSMKYPDRLMAMMDLNGNISYGDGKIRLENLNGRYGDSPVQLEGEIDRKNIKKLEYALRLNFPELVRSDLKDIPLFKDFKFEGPAHVSLNLNGDLDSFKFEHQADLARVQYQIPGFMEKQPNALNKFKAKGNVLKNGGIIVDSWSYELGGNRVLGTASIPDLDNPEFTINMASNNFQVYPSRQFFRFLDAEMDGTTDFKITGSGNLNNLQDSKFEGEMKLQGMKVRPKNLLSPLTVDANLRFKEDRLDIRSGNIKSDQSGVTFSGVYHRGEAPSLDLNLAGKRLNVDEFLPEPQDKETSLMERLNQSEFFAKGKGKIRFNLDKLDYKLFTLDQVAGSMVLNNREIEMKDLVFDSNASIKSGGRMLIDAKGVGHFEGSIQARGMETKNLFSFFGDVFEKSLSGDVKTVDARLKGSGKDWKEIFSSLSGNLSMDVQSGSINLEKLQRGVRRLFSSIPQPNPVKNEAPSSFKQISGDFATKDGVFETQNFVVETEDRRTSIVGTFDLVNNQMDTVVGIAPLAGLDRFLTQIPVVGKIITGGDEKSILKSYYTVKGDFNNPEVTVTPFTSLGKRVMGIFQAILETPQDILAPITDNLPKATSPTPAEN
ncbi:MAG: AsmA family protein [Nitrospina sp.]|nr:AsmA family protein [Nitrospina sp.]